jgi:hypothetical protein
MAAKLKYKRMLITRMQTKFRSFATFHNLINSHWSLPLNILVETRKKQVHNVSKLYTHYDISVGCGLGLVRIDWRADLFPVVWRIFPTFLSADFLHSLLLSFFQVRQKKVKMTIKTQLIGRDPRNDSEMTTFYFSMYF